MLVFLRTTNISQLGCSTQPLDLSINRKRYNQEPLASHWPVERLRWFSKGLYKVSEQQGKVIMSDLRMGLEPDYVFAFQVGKISNPHPVPTTSKRQTSNRNWQRLPPVMRRIWDEQAL